MSWLRTAIKALTPPLVLDAARRALRRNARQTNEAPEWQYIPEGWSYAGAHPEVTGWDVAAVLETSKAKWPRFVQMVEGTGPLGISPESDLSTATGLFGHNIVMSYAYVLARAARNRTRLSLLDWGGGIGHYYLLARALLPGVEIEYHCKDLTLLAEHGARLFPDQHFYADESCLGRRYDLVLAASSLQYSQDWKRIAAGLANAAGGCLYVTRMPVVDRTASYVALQRAHRYGYATEYLCWFLNRLDLIRVLSENDMMLMREFAFGAEIQVPDAPEPGRLWGAFFERAEGKPA